jgi:hypothetical protein
MATPALHILLSLCDAPLSARALATETSHALFRCGLLLAGMAPALALYSATAGQTVSTLLGLLGLYFAGAVGLSALIGGVFGALAGSDRSVVAPATAALAAYGLFAISLVLRISAHFPLFGGAS